MEGWLRVVLALPFRLPMKFIHLTLLLVAPLSFTEQGLCCIYSRALGKNGWWHTCYDIEHWPLWLQ